jgi:hypothetical protein
VIFRTLGRRRLLSDGAVLRLVRWGQIGARRLHGVSAVEIIRRVWLLRFRWKEQRAVRAAGSVSHGEERQLQDD